MPADQYAPFFSYTQQNYINDKITSLNRLKSCILMCIMANAMNPDQTAPKDPYCLQYRLPKYNETDERADNNCHGWWEKG